MTFVCGVSLISLGMARMVTTVQKLNRVGSNTLVGVPEGSEPNIFPVFLPLSSGFVSFVIPTVPQMKCRQSAGRGIQVDTTPYFHSWR